MEPPIVHPKTASISAEIAALSNGTSSRYHQPALGTMQELGNEEYVAPDVFRIDRQTQEEIDVSPHIHSPLVNTHLYPLHLSRDMSHDCGAVLL